MGSIDRANFIKNPKTLKRGSQQISIKNINELKQRQRNKKVN